ncbi:MAG TPA: hypothetical protein VF494_08275 [Candidatus Limnocylindrales bacterium]
MAAPFVPIATVAGFGLFIVAVTRLNEGRPVEVGGIFPANGRSDWPRGIQERDVPRFAIDRAPATRAGPAGDAVRDQEPWIEELPAPLPSMPAIERIVARPPHLALRY